MTESRPWHQHYDQLVPTTIRYPRIPVPQLLDLPSRVCPTKPALHFLGSTISFLELRRLALKLANALAGLGIVKGDRVMLHLPNCPQYPIAYYGALLNGAIVVNANPMFTPSELALMCEETQPRALITFDGAAPAVEQLLQAVEIPHVILTGVRDYAGGDPPKSLPDGWHGFRRLEEQGRASLPRVDLRPSDPAQIQFTGGTTGMPKGAVLTHANVIAAVHQCCLWGAGLMSLVPPADRVTMAVLPYFHVYGNIVMLNSSLLNCASQIVVPRFELEEFLSVLAGYDRITYFPSVPTMIGAIVTKRCIFSSRTAENPNAHQLLGSGVVGDV